MLSDRPLTPRSFGTGNDHNGPSRGKKTNNSSINGSACSSSPPANLAVGQGRVAIALCCKPISAASKAVTGNRLNSATSMLSSNR
ncbi:hypothetical protein D9M68_781610 [compost metagenome]